MAVWVSLSNQSVWGKRLLHADVAVIVLIEESVENIYCMEKCSEENGGLEKQFENVRTGW